MMTGNALFLVYLLPADELRDYRNVRTRTTGDRPQRRILTDAGWTWPAKYGMLIIGPGSCEMSF